MDPERKLKRKWKLEMASLLKTIITGSSLMPFRWHTCKFMCFYCSEHFIEVSKLREHYESHTTVYLHDIIRNILNKRLRIKLDVVQIWCTDCPSELDTFDDYIDHLKEYHEKVFDKDVIGRFEVFNLGDDEMSCVECGSAFKHFPQLLKHTHQNHIDVEKSHKYLCEICGQGFADKNVVITHINQTHYAQKCKYCSETFETCYALDKHIGTVHRVEKYQCPLCLDNFPNRYMRKRHLALVHDCKSAQLTCDVCHKIFTRNSKLLLHKRRVHMKEKNIACEECGIQFFDAESLDKHKVCHSDERPFRCSLCPKTFRRKQTLDIHVAGNHPLSAFSSS